MGSKEHKTVTFLDGSKVISSTETDASDAKIKATFRARAEAKGISRKNAKVRIQNHTLKIDRTYPLFL